MTEHTPSGNSRTRPPRHRVRMDLSPELVSAIQRTPEFQVKPYIGKAIRLIVESRIKELEGRGA